MGIRGTASILTEECAEEAADLVRRYYLVPDKKTQFRGSGSQFDSWAVDAAGERQVGHRRNYRNQDHGAQMPAASSPSAGIDALLYTFIPFIALRPRGHLVSAPQFGGSLTHTIEGSISGPEHRGVGGQSFEAVTQNVWHSSQKTSRTRAVPRTAGALYDGQRWTRRRAAPAAARKH
jgi:hypothetical protein